jgi:hypothetical protein
MNGGCEINEAGKNQEFNSFNPVHNSFITRDV